MATIGYNLHCENEKFQRFVLFVNIMFCCSCFKFSHFEHRLHIEAETSITEVERNL